MGRLSLVVALGLSAAACTSPPRSRSVSPSAVAPVVSATSFTADYSAMATLEPLIGQGHGTVAAILPDESSSTRYVEFDAPDLIRAMTRAGLPAPDQVVQNAQGSDATELADAEADIADGAGVLVLDSIDATVGAQVEAYARSHGVPVVEYDRLAVGGTPTYYVSFDDVEAGRLMGQGLVSCISSWHVSSPKLMVMRGASSDDNAAYYYQGYYDDVLRSYFGLGRYRDVVNTAGTWDPSTALTEFQDAYRQHPDIDAALTANDETAAPIIAYLSNTLHVAARTFPTTGQDATLSGLQNVLAGYQCGTVYKPIYLEAQAAVALALYLRAAKTPPPGLVNGTTRDAPAPGRPVPSVLLAPEWVTTADMADTVVKDGFVPVSALCAGSYAADCARAGI